MTLRIVQDHNRFRNIVRGQIRKNLKKYISNGDLIARQGDGLISVPIPHIDIPQLKFRSKQQGGVGQGDGDAGDPLSGADDESAGRQHGAGNQSGEHALEIEVSLEELADILGEELELPNLRPKGSSVIKQTKERYAGVRPVGPNSLRHFRRTFRRALHRQISMGTYDPKDPIIIPTHEDMRYKSWKWEEKPTTNAVIIYMMDVSGSMGDEQKEIVRIESFWIDTWIRRHYKDIQTRFIIHDATAREVDRDTFFRTRESGGTMISSAYQLVANMIESDYPGSEWNVYPFHFSDGDNWSVDDTLLCIDLLKQKLMPASNVFCYGQVESPYGSGQFIKDLKQHLGENPQLVTSEIADRESIVASIRDFFGRPAEAA